MTLHFSFYPVLLVLTSIGLAVVASLVWPYRRTVGALALIGLLIATSEWCLAVAFELASTTPEMDLLWSVIAYIGIAFSPVLAFLFLIDYTQQSNLIQRRFRWLLWVIPTISLGMAATNSLHHLLWDHVEVVSQPFHVVYYYGPYFWVHVGYSYLMLMGGLFALIVAAGRFKETYLQQVRILMFAMVFPFASNIIYVLKLNPFPWLDLTPISFGLMAFMLSYSLLRYHLLDLVPVARDALIEYLSDGVVVLDPFNRIVDINPAARSSLNIQGSVIGEKANQVFSNWPLLAGLVVSDKEIQQELEMHSEPARFCDVGIVPLLDHHGRVTGRMVTLRDITVRKLIERELAQKSLELQRLAVTDSLTGLFNRRHVEEAMLTEFSRCERYGTPLAIGMCDLDDFKQVNDRFGHFSGDEVLQVFAEQLRLGTRQVDIVARFGGDEFLILFPHTHLQEAWAVLDRIRVSLEQHTIADMVGHLTFSGGVTAWLAGDKPDEALRRADRLLYQAKQAGNNRIMLDELPQG